MNENIKGKVVAVTGASSGIGLAIAEALALRGAKVVLGARRVDRLELIVNNIRDKGGEATYIEVDVTQRKSVENLVELAVQAYGKLDVLVNNAGVAQLYLMEELDVDGWEQMIDVNIKGPLYGIAAALPVFNHQGYGHIINILSTAGIRIVPQMGVYAGTKNAMRTINEGLRQESRGRWRVTGISPGYVKSEFAANIKNEKLKSASQKMADEIAIPAEAVANTVIFAMEQPDNVDIGDIVIRPTLQE